MIIREQDFQTPIIRWEACSQTRNLIEFTVRSAKNIERNCRMKISNGTTDPRHRRRNIRPPATTDQALRAARPKGRPHAWSVAFLSPEMSTLEFGHSIITPSVQVTEKTFNDNCIAFCPIRDTALPIFIQIPRFHPPLWHFSAKTRHSTLSLAPNVRPVFDGPQVVFSQIY